MVLIIRADLHQDQPFTPRIILHLGVSPQIDEYGIVKVEQNIWNLIQ